MQVFRVNSPLWLIDSGSLSDLAKKTLDSLRLLVLAALFATVSLLSLTAGAGLDFDRLQQALSARFNNQWASARFDEWRQMLGNGQGTSEAEKLRRVNDFFNHRVAFDDDFSVWGQSDYWATPMEFIGQGRGDCEDFSIGKYYSLLNLGIPVAKLRLVYVKALLNGVNGPVQQAHMVLVYYASPSADPLVLDNLVPEIRPASRRSDLSPIFSFNSSGLWQGTGNQSSQSNLSRWQDLLARARAEGFQ